MSKLDKPPRLRPPASEVLRHTHAPEIVQPSTSERIPSTEEASHKQEGLAQTIARIKREVAAGNVTQEERNAGKRGAGSINLHQSLPIHFDAIAKLDTTVGVMMGDRQTRMDIQGLQPSPKIYSGISMVASVIAHRRNSDIPIQVPTEDDLGKMGWYRRIHGFLGLFSPVLADWFKSRVEQEGERRILKAGLRVIDIADTLSSIENPRAQLLEEIALLYRTLQKPAVTGDFFESEVSIEVKIRSFLTMLKEAKHDPKAFDNSSFDPRKFPLILGLLPKLNMPPDKLNQYEISLAAQELMEGVEKFLKQHGISDIDPAPHENSVDRTLTEFLAGGKMDRVRVGFPTALEYLLDAMPTNGPKAADQIYAIAETICALHAQGTSAEEIAHRMFAKTN